MSPQNIFLFIFSLILGNAAWAAPTAIEFYLTPKEKVGKLSKDELILQRKIKQGSVPKHHSARVYDVDSDGVAEFIFFEEGAWGPNSRCSFYHYDKESDRLDRIARLDLFEFYDDGEYFEVTIKAGRNTWASEYYPKTLFKQAGNDQPLFQKYNTYDMDTDESTCTLYLSHEFSKSKQAKDNFFAKKPHLTTCTVKLGDNTNH